MTTIASIVADFIETKGVINYKAGHLHVEDRALYSYNAVIAKFTPNGLKVSLGYQPSKTTTTHRNRVLQEAKRLNCTVVGQIQ